MDTQTITTTTRATTMTLSTSTEIVSTDWKQGLPVL